MEMVDIDGNNSTLLYFETLSELANLQVDPLNEEEWREQVNNKEREHSWFGMKGIAEVREACELYGWDAGMEKGLAAFASLTAPQLPSLKRKRCYSSGGHTFDMQRLYSGKPEKAWRTSRREQSENKMAHKGLVNIVVNIAANCGVSADAFFWRGALAMLYAKALMESGRRARILAVMPVDRWVQSNPHDKKGDSHLMIAVEVKAYGQALNLGSMFAMTALSGFFRYYGFKAILSTPFKVSGGLGTSVSVKNELLEPLLDDSPALVIENIWSQEAAMAKSVDFTKELMGEEAR